MQWDVVPLESWVVCHLRQHEQQRAVQLGWDDSALQMPSLHGLLGGQVTSRCLLGFEPSQPRPKFLKRESHRLARERLDWFLDPLAGIDPLKMLVDVVAGIPLLVDGKLNIPTCTGMATNCFQTFPVTFNRSPKPLFLPCLPRCLSGLEGLLPGSRGSTDFC